MRASHEWLRAFVPHALSPDGVAALISTHVATVDAIEPLRADLAPIVVARVLTAVRHPESDHLWLTTVDDGSGAPLDVVCGASNVAAGTLYPFARTGTQMPNGMQIVKRKIRGAVSNGMLCSADELLLGDDHDGILALTVDVPPGTPLLDAMPLGDTRFEIDVLPNRPDLLCHVGLARELSALSGVALRVPAELASLAPAPAPALAATEGTTDGVPVRIEDVQGCPRYLAVVIRGVTVGPSPAWLRDRLASVGVRSISNVVDVTNYCLHAFGQPMHAFDLARLKGPGIVVRRARAGERLTTLDGVDRVLKPDMLVIADRERAVGIAGVIGGRDSEVTETTTDILLEVANFDPSSVRRTRRALGISTDASHRFERGTDAGEVAPAASLAAALISDLAGGRVAGTPVLVGSAPAARATVSLRASRVARLLGDAVPAAEIVERLSSIGFRVNLGSDDELGVTPPSWRHDVTRDVDLIEDVARLRGFDALSDALAAFRPSAVPDHPLHARSRRVRDALVGAGFAEVRPLPFVKGDERTHVRVTNPLADDEPFLRRDILETLARRAEHNLSRREGNLRLFEIGSVFLPAPGTVREEYRVGALFMGHCRPAHFTESQPPAFDVWDAKGIALELAEAIYGSRASLADGTGGVLWNVRAGDDIVGLVRRVSLDAPAWADAAYGCELTLGALPLAPVAAPGAHAHTISAVPDASDAPRYRALPTTPAAEFDLAFLVRDDLPAARVEEALRRAAGDLLERLALFDEFRGAGVPEGHRSLAWRLTFRHPERTLNERELGGRRQKLIDTVEKDLGVVARTG